MENIIREIEKRNCKTVYTCHTLYNLLLAVYIVTTVKRYENSYIVMYSYEKRVLDAFADCSYKMNRMGIRNVIINKHTKFHRLIGASDVVNRKIYKEVMLRINVKEDDFLLVNFSWDQQDAFYPASMYLKRCKQAIFIEEGATQWNTPDEKSWYRFLKKLYGNQTQFWNMNKLEAIYVQQPDKFPTYMRNKLSKFCLKKCLVNAPKETERIVMEIFSDAEKREEIRQLDKVEGIVFTQPLSEDGFITEKEKIRIYTQLVKFYEQYGVVALKIHPRDTADYSVGNTRILKGSYPSELLSMLGIRFRFAIGICTSAVETVEADIRMNLNDAFLREHRYELKPLSGLTKQFEEGNIVM